MICWCMGCLPYFAVTGIHTILPLDIAKATYLVPPPTSTLLTTDLIASQAIALQKWKSHLSALHFKVMAASIPAAICFKQEHSATVYNFNFSCGDLVLVWNTAIEKAFNQKMHAQYLEPLIVVFYNKGGAYIYHLQIKWISIWQAYSSFLSYPLLCVKSNCIAWPFQFPWYSTRMFTWHGRIIVVWWWRFRWGQLTYLSNLMLNLTQLQLLTMKTTMIKDPPWLRTVKISVRRRDTDHANCIPLFLQFLNVQFLFYSD